MNNIRKIRKLLKISVAEFAKLLECSEPQIYALETERVELDEKWIIKIAKIFNCDQSLLTKQDFHNDDIKINQLPANTTTIKILPANTTSPASIDLLHLLTNNKQINDYSNLAMCTSDDKTIIVDLSTKNITSNKQLFIIKIKNSNEIKIATIMKDMWTEKIVLQIDNMDVKLFENQQQFDNDCELLGRVVSRIVDC